MSSPPKDRTIIEPNVVIIDSAQEVHGVEVSAIAGSFPIDASTKVTTKDTSTILRPVASSGLCKVDGVWKGVVQVLTTCKAHVDSVCPIAKTAYVYYDDDVYDSALIEKSTGITYVTQLIFDSATEVYYIYHRWGENNYELDGPHEAIDSAKETFQVSYKEKFGVEWTERESTTSERWTYEIKTYEPFEEMEEVEEVFEETEAEDIIACQKEIVVEDTQINEETNITATKEDVTLDHETREETFVVKEDCETVKEVLVRTKILVLTHPAVPQESSWFRRVASGAGVTVVGAGAIAAGVASGTAGVAYDTFVLEKIPPAGGKKSGSAGLSPVAIAAVMDASRM